MIVKYAEQDTLAILNATAIESGGNAIREDAVSTLNRHLRYPVVPALPIPPRMGWTRCWVLLGPDECHRVLLDIRDTDLNRLPGVEINRDAN